MPSLMTIAKGAAVALAAVYVYNRFIADASKGESIATFGKPPPPAKG